MKILVTGCAGFIGFHLAKKLLEKDFIVYGVDNLNHYYDIKLKKARLKILKNFKNFSFNKRDINDKSLINFYQKKKIKIIIHLAAQAGVRYSIKNPDAYIHSNLTGFYNILKMSKFLKVKHLMLASTSSVYGTGKKFPLKENYNTNNPISLYSATKKSNEILAHSYSVIYKIPITCLRFFTVFGPYGRPDMALFRFTEAILNKKKVELYNFGNHIRDFTYIDDTIEMIVKLLKKQPTQKIPFNILNISNSKPIKLKKYIEFLQKSLKLKAKFKKLPLQTGDVFKTHGSNKKIIKRIGKINSVKIEKGIEYFVNWYKEFYNINIK